MSAADRVVVIGAGPAGAATALRLARMGIGVTVVERARFPRRKVCGEYLGTGSVALLDELELGDIVRNNGSPLHAIRIVAGSARATLELTRPAVAIARERLDALILDAACRAGASLEYGRVEDLAHGANGRVRGVVVRGDDGECRTLQARIVVGADGTGSIVARKMGLTLPVPPDARFAIGGHYRGLGDLEACVEMYAGARAYFAVNPLNADLANVMVVVRKNALETWSRSVDERMAGKATELAAGLRDFQRAQRVGARVSIGPLAHRVRRATFEGGLLVGDAAGFVDPFTGQGIYLALRGSQRAADAVRAAFGGSAERRAFDVYERETFDELRARGRLARLVDTLVRVPVLARRAATRLGRSPALGSVFLDALSGSLPAGSALTVGTLRRLLV